MIRLIAGSLSILSLFIAISGYAQPLTVTNLRCESRTNPIGVDTKKPVFSWELRSTQQNVMQSAYRIIVSDNDSLFEKDQGNIWDSKKITSSASIQVEYKGKELQPAKKYYWKLMVWDNKGNLSQWAKAEFQMGLIAIDPIGWSNAKWIAYDILPDSNKIIPFAHGRGKKEWGARKDILPLLRKSFTISKPIKQATAFICGLGQFELSINGEKTGDHFLDPGWTQYSKHALYVSFDISRQLKQGENAIGVMLGNGFYYIPGERYRKLTGAFGYPKMILKLAIEYTDGTVQSIISDASWKTAPSPVIFSSIYGGEDYDAGLEQAGWNTDSFDDSKWKNAIITDGPPVLQSQMTEPVKIMDKFPIASASQLKSNIWVFDLAQNSSAIPFITVRGKKGDTVRIIPAELVNDDGSANQRGTGGPSFYTYILKGDGKESWRPRFNYYGFRYLQVQAIGKDSTQLPEILSVEGWHIRNAATTVGEFTSSNELFNKTNELINWAIKSNMVSVFTDCPHREKLGWLEQTHLMGNSVQYNYDIAALNRKITRDMMNAQTADGLMPGISPEFVHFEDPFRDSPEWGSAAIILPWYNYKWYGDKRTLTEAYDMMKKYIEYLRKKASNHILSQGLGDWYDIGPNRPGFSQLTKMGITATAIYYYDLMLMTEIATLLNKQADVKQYHQLSMAVKNAFNKKFFDTQKLQYDSASQTANAIALHVGLVEPKYRNAVIEALVKDIRSRNNALTAGDVGYRYVLRALEESGRNDVIFDMNSRDDVPGYGYQLKNGATALTESWQALPSVSNNHFMLGHLMEWFYTGLAGIRLAKNGVAFNKIEIAPQPVGDLTHVKARFASPYGPVVSEWKKENGNFALTVEIPANTTAVIYLPDGKKANVGSGKYTFNVKQ